MADLGSGSPDQSPTRRVGVQRKTRSPGAFKRSPHSGPASPAQPTLSSQGSEDQPPPDMSDSGFSFLLNSNPSAGELAGIKEGEEQSASLALANGGEDANGELPTSGFDFILGSSSSAPGVGDDDPLSEGSGFSFMTSSAATNGMADSREGDVASPFSMLSSAGLTDKPIPPLGGGNDTETGGGDEGGGSAFSFLSSSSAPDFGAATIAEEPSSSNNSSHNHSLLGLDAASSSSGGSRGTALDKLAELEALMSQGTTTTTPGSTSTIAPPSSVASLSRASSGSSSTTAGGMGSLSDLSMLSSPAPPITFERTATSKAGIRKKKTSVKVGYARDEPDPVAAPPPPPPEPPRLQPSPAPTPTPHSLAQPTTAAPATTNTPPQSSLSSSPSVPESSPHRRQTSSSEGTSQPQAAFRRSTSSSSDAMQQSPYSHPADPSIPVIVQATGGVPSGPLRAMQPPSSSAAQSPSLSTRRAAPLPATATSSTSHRPSIDSPQQQQQHERKKPNNASGGGGGGGFFSSLFGGGGGAKKEQPPAPAVPREAPAPRAFPASMRMIVDESSSNSNNKRPPATDATAPPVASSPAVTPPPPPTSSGGDFSDDTGSEGEEDGVPSGTTRRKSRGQNSAKASLPHTEASSQAPSEPMPPSYPPTSRGGVGGPALQPDPEPRFKRSTSQQQQPSQSAAQRPVEPPKDPVERNKVSVESILKGFQKEATNLCFRQQELRRKQVKATTEKEALIKQQTSFQEELRKYEAEQQRLAEKEEFDRAEALQHVIDQVKQQTSSAAKNLQDITSEANQLEKDRSDSLDEQRRLLEGMVAQLRDFLSSRAKELETFLLESTTSLEAERKRLASEEERISMEMSNVDKDEASIKEEFEKVEKAIEGQTSDLYVRKVEAQGRVVVVDEEITRLEEELRVKRGERERLQADLNAVEGEIAKVKGKFERPLLRLKEKERVLSSSRKDMLGEKTVLEEQKHAHGLSATAVKAEEGRMKALVEQVSMELQVADLLTGTFLSQEKYQQNLIEGDAGSPATAVTLLHDLQVEVAEAEEQSHLVQKEHDRLQSLIISLKEEMEAIDLKLPLLEQSKKEAAASRNYKEAGNRSKEIKALQTRREEAEEELGKAREEADGMREALAKRQQVLHECRERLREREKDAESKKVDILTRKAKELKRARASLGRLGGARIQTSAELMIQAELEAAETEREVLIKRYGITVLAEEEEGEDDGIGEGREAAEEPQVVVDGSAAAVASAEHPSSPAVVGHEPLSSAPTVVEEGDEGQVVVSADAIAKARELHLQIIGLEERLQGAAAEEDYDLAEELNTEIEALKERIAALGPIDVVDLIMGDEEEADDDDEEEVVVEGLHPPDGVIKTVTPAGSDSASADGVKASPLSSSSPRREGEDTADEQDSS